MGIRTSIKKRLKIIAGIEPDRPAQSYQTKAPNYEPPPPPPPPMTEEEARAMIQADIDANPVMLFTKGTKQAPACGFSATVIGIFDQLGVPFETRNVVADPTLRQAIKEFSDWPTIPQIYLAGEFIGGCDIVRQMQDSGELKTAVEKALQAPA